MLKMITRYSYSLSSLEAIKNRRTEVKLVYAILKDFTDFTKAENKSWKRKEIILC